MLVHHRRGCRDARPDVAHVGEVEQPLDRAVLAERAVQQGEDDVDLAEGARRLAGLVDDEGAVGRARRHDDARRGGVDLRDVAGGQPKRGRVVGREHPVAVPGDADGHDVVLGPVERLEHAGGRGARHRVLGGAAPEDEGDAGPAGRLPVAGGLGAGLVGAHRPRLYPLAPRGPDAGPPTRRADGRPRGRPTAYPDAVTATPDDAATDASHDDTDGGPDRLSRRPASSGSAASPPSPEGGGRPPRAQLDLPRGRRRRLRALGQPDVERLRGGPRRPRGRRRPRARLGDGCHRRRPCRCSPTAAPSSRPTPPTTARRDPRRARGRRDRPPCAASTSPTPRRRRGPRRRRPALARVPDEPPARGRRPPDAPPGRPRARCRLGRRQHLRDSAAPAPARGRTPTSSSTR